LRIGSRRRFEESTASRWILNMCGSIDERRFSF
jgi:hypothetical protein